MNHHPHAPPLATPTNTAPSPLKVHTMDAPAQPLPYLTDEVNGVTVDLWDVDVLPVVRDGGQIILHAPGAQHGYALDLVERARGILRGLCPGLLVAELALAIPRGLVGPAALVRSPPRHGEEAVAIAPWLIDGASPPPLPRQDIRLAEWVIPSADLLLAVTKWPYVRAPPTEQEPAEEAPPQGPVSVPVVATRADLERMALQWMGQNGKAGGGVETVTLPLGFVSTLAEFMDPDCKRQPGNWHTARTFPEVARHG